MHPAPENKLILKLTRLSLKLRVVSGLLDWLCGAGLGPELQGRGKVSRLLENESDVMIRGEGRSTLGVRGAVVLGWSRALMAAKLKTHR